MSCHEDSLPPPPVTGVTQNNLLNPVSRCLTNRSIFVTELLNLLLSFDAWWISSAVYSLSFVGVLKRDDNTEGINLTSSVKVILKELPTFITRLVCRPESSLNLHICVLGKYFSMVFEWNKNGSQTTHLIFHRNLNRLHRILWSIPSVSLL